MKKVVIIFFICVGIISVPAFFLLKNVKVKQYLFGRGTDNSALDELKTLPYLQYVKKEANPGKKGVTIYDEDRAFNGLSLFSPDGIPRAYLIDMAGKTVHSWHFPSAKHWDLAQIDNETNILIVADPGERSAKNGHLLKLNWDSELIWQRFGRFHHDIEFAENGDIYTLQTKATIQVSSVNKKISDHYITILSSDGNIKKEIPIYEILKNDPKINKVLKDILAKWDGEFNLDLMHTNTLKLLKEDISIAKKGDILVSMRNLDLIAIIDPDTLKIVWQWGMDDLDRQHQPTILDNGNILIFDNGWHRGYSRVIELDPRTREIVWEYTADPRDSFFSKERSGAERLPNGNTLITESEKGRVFEVTRSKEIVWEWFNPFFNNKGKRKALYRMSRLDKKTQDILPVNNK